MFNKVNLRSVAERLQWKNWNEIKNTASNEAGFFDASNEEKEILEKNLNLKIHFSLENINRHAKLVKRETNEIYEVFFVKINEDFSGFKKKIILMINNKEEKYSDFDVIFSCPSCENEYSFNFAPKNLSKDSPFCKKCLKETLHKCDSYRKTYEKSMIEKYGVTRPLRTEKSLEKYKQSMSEKYGKHCSFIAEECVEKRKETMMSLYGRENYFSQINPWVVFGFTHTPGCIGISNLEKEIVCFLDEHIFSENETYSYKNKQYRFQNKETYGFFDYYVKDLNIAIEVLGDYWHANPIFYQSASKMKRGLLAEEIWKFDKDRLESARNSLGCHIFQIWENDWKKNKEKVITEIQELKNNV